MLLKEAVRIWGLHTMLIENREGQRDTSGRANNFLEGKWRERALKEKQMTFWKDKWALGEWVGYVIVL